MEGGEFMFDKYTTTDLIDILRETRKEKEFLELVLIDEEETDNHPAVERRLKKLTLKEQEIVKFLTRLSHGAF